MPDPWGPLLLQLVLILVSGWFAATEAAVLSLSEAKLRHDADEGDKTAAKLLKLNESPDNFISTIRVCVTLAGFMGAAYAGAAFTDDVAALTKLPVPVCMALVTLLLAFFTLVLGVMVPKRLGMYAPEKLARSNLGLMSIFCAIFTPVVWLISALSGLLLWVMGVDPDAAEEEVTEEDIRLMVDMGEEAGAIEEAEKEMIENIFEFNNQTAETVMTHRTDVTCVWVEEDWDVIIETIRETGLSRFPVYNEDRDDIIGTLNTRVFLLNMQAEKPRTMREMLREAYFVPETVPADQLFRDMQTRKIHMAIVVDEYGGMSGIVTMEDLLEEIVGNIYDEFDHQEEAEILSVSPGVWRISGQAMLTDVADALDVTLPLEEDYDTLGGLIFSQFTTIPEDGSTPEIQCHGLNIKVERIEEHRVEWATVTKVEQKAEETD